MVLLMHLRPREAVRIRVVTILSDTKIAGEREFESTGQSCAENGGDYWFWHALAQRGIALSKNLHCRSRSRATRDRKRAGLCEADNLSCNATALETCQGNRENSPLEKQVRTGDFSLANQRV